jgi:hypothetical protein
MKLRPHRQFKLPDLTHVTTATTQMYAAAMAVTGSFTFTAFEIKSSLTGSQFR